MAGTGEGNCEAFRSGGTVVVPDGGRLPARCIKCNAPASGEPIRYTFVDSAVAGAPHGAASAVIHFGTRRKAQVYLSMCEHHRRLRKLIRCSPLLFPVAVAVGVYANMAYPKPPEVLVWLSVLLVFAALFPLGVYQQHYLKARIANGRVWISGAGDSFVASLPSQPSDPHS